MKDKDRDILDDIFRSKLQHVEAETNPDDWEAIMNRLPRPTAISLRRRRIYWAAAAVSLLLMMGGGFYLTQNNTVNTAVAKRIEKETQTIKSRIRQEAPLVLAIAERPAQTTERPVPQITEKPIQPSIETIQLNKANTYLDIAREENKTIAPLPQKQQYRSESRTTATQPAARKWGFGMGAGGFSEGSGNVVNTYVLRSSSLDEDGNLLSMNANSDYTQGNEPKTNIKHKMPLSFGFAVSRQLNNRFSLQSGVVYSFLKSEWETQGSTYNKEIRQQLHFIGIPLSLNYRIADWNRFRFYASAGVQAEINVAGKERTKKYLTDLANENRTTSVNTISVRMKEWQWSVNARAGVSYPLLPFLSAYGEVGAAYYFDNNSKIETFYSDKPFNFSPQIGLRLNF